MAVIVLRSQSMRETIARRAANPSKAMHAIAIAIVMKRRSENAKLRAPAAAMPINTR